MSASSEKPVGQTSASSVELWELLQRLRRRMLSVGMIAAGGWLLLAVLAVLLVAIWLDLLWDLSPTARWTALLVAVVVGLSLFGCLLVSLFRKSSGANLAQRLDVIDDTGGEITSALELSLAKRTDRSATEIEQGLAALAVDRAARRASAVDQRLAIPLQPVKTVAWVLGIVALSLAAIGFSMPKLAWTQWSRFTSPASDVPPFSTLDFAVTPGDIEVKYGSPVDISAQLNMTAIDDLQLWIKGSSDELVPMFDEGDDRWRALLGRVTEPLEYQVRSGRARSEKYQIRLLLVPEISEVQFRVTPPAYTEAGSSVVRAQDSIRGLCGTKVTVTATSNMPLSGGKLVIKNQDRTSEVSLQPDDRSSTQVTGTFSIEQSGKFELTLSNQDGMESISPFSGSIEQVPDERPYVRLGSPKQSSLAIASVRLPVSINAEDDFGIAKIGLYRSLNDSRPLPLDIPLDQTSKSEKRVTRQLLLPLDQYDLQPGDKLELFARVEDNEPSVNKGSESPVHVVQIISREQYDQMNREQLGVESMLSRYRQIQRRLEGLEQMQREIEAMSDQPEEEKQQVEQQQRQKMVEAADSFGAAAREMQELLQRHFPIDVDEALDPQIEEMAEKMDKVAREIRELIKQLEDQKLDNDELKKRLAELREELEGLREEFEDQVMEPMEQLASVFELLKKQNEFIQVVLRQRNLADRLQSLDGQDDVQKATVKRRFRELSDEQTTLKTWLEELVEAIENLAIVLPPDEELRELQESALGFAVKVNQSGATEEQDQAATSLAELSGSDGFGHGARAAEILESLVDEANGMGEQGEAGVNRIFAPNMGRPQLGNSLAQMMKMFGPRYGSRQRGSSNRGLYGDQDQAERRGGGQGEDQQRGGGGMARARPSNIDPGNEVRRGGGKTGMSQTPVPLQYERKVSEYYRRLVEELGDDL